MESLDVRVIKLIGVFKDGELWFNEFQQRYECLLHDIASILPKKRLEQYQDLFFNQRRPEKLTKEQYVQMAFGITNGII